MTTIHCEACKVEHEVGDAFSGFPVIRCPAAPAGQFYLSQHPNNQERNQPVTTTYGREIVGEHPLDDQEATIDFEGPSAVYMSRNPSVSKGQVWLRGLPVPHIELFKVPVGDDGQQVYPITENTDGTVTVHPHEGPYSYELCLDNRWAFDFATEAEAVHAASMMADAMAVAIGRTCHGSPNRLTRHGPVIADQVADNRPLG